MTEGFEVIAAYSGKECLEKNSKLKTFLILLDIMMPGMDGWEVFHKIKEDYKDIPVAILTVRTGTLTRCWGSMY